ncbi:MAG TPA: sigma-54 dependent transcriptional regulator [Candidatus Hydrogenedentes bacterium]|nr:sigma-54 dependent transcriptional regulator [Candidatus Hydrogenedentota bacterium]
MHTILAIDDEAGVRQSYRVMLSDQYRVLLAENGREGLSLLEQRHADLILLDLTMPQMSGIAFLEELARRGEDIPVIVVTGTGSVDSAVAAMKLGAREYVIKPFNVTEVLLAVERLLAERHQELELAALREAGAAGHVLIGEAPAFLQAVERARQAMEVDSTVLITGESGTGKDVVARAIHYGGKRASKTFVPISCCAIPPNLVESELFGHEKGAFTGATEKRQGKMRAADGGTLFLDEIGEMPLEAQGKLLRVLQDGCFYPVGSSKSIETDVRFVCATNRVLPEAIAQGLFRQDLYYRINVIPIEMPPLRRRREDIPKLAAHFLAKHAPRIDAKAVEFAPDAMAALQAYSWPGNVRELENTVERILVCNRARKTIGRDCLEGVLAGAPVTLAADVADFDGLPLDEAVARLERRLIGRALERANGVQSRAAELLGTTRRILKYKMDQLGMAAETDTEG